MSGPTADHPLDFLRSGAGQEKSQKSANLTVSHLQGTQGSFHLSQVQNRTCHTLYDTVSKQFSGSLYTICDLPTLRFCSQNAVTRRKMMMKE